MVTIPLILLGAMILGFVWWKINRARFRDVFSPFAVLFPIWVLPFIASFLEISGLQHGMSPTAIAIVLIVTAVMALTLLAPPLFPGRRDDALHAEGVRCRLATVSPVRLALLSGLLILVALGARLVSEFSEGIPVLAYIEDGGASSALHRVGKDSKLQIVAAALSVGGMLSWYCALQATGRPLIRAGMFMLAAIPLLVGILKASKSDIAEPVFFYLLVFAYTRTRVRKLAIAKYAAAAVPVLLMLIFITELRLEGQGARTYAEEIEFEATALPGATRPVASQLYGYMVLGFENFSRYVEESEPELRPGTSMLRPLFSAVMRGDIPTSMLEEVELKEVSPAANVGTFLRDLYIEGGVVLCIIGAFWNALVIRLAYGHFRKHQDDVSMFIYVILLFPWVWLFFTNAFSVLTVYTNCAVGALVLFLSRDRACYRRIDMAEC